MDRHDDLLDSHIAGFMYWFEYQSKGLPHKHKVFMISDNIDMNKKKVRENIFNTLEILTENNGKKMPRDIAFKKVVGNSFFQSPGKYHLKKHVRVKQPLLPRSNWQGHIRNQVNIFNQLLTQPRYVCCCIFCKNIVTSYLLIFLF